MDKYIIETCPLCHSNRLKYAMKCCDFHASGEKFDLFSCEDCNFLFTQGTPTGEGIEKYYATPQYISHSNTKKGIINTTYHLVRSYTLRKKTRMVIYESHRRTGRILDIGAGTGYFADAMVGRGWTVNATEKNIEARAFAKEYFGLEIKDERALHFFKPDSFNVITLWHTMEHMEKLNEIWQRLYELLTDKGILIVAVPNNASYDAKKYKEYWAAYDVPRHLWHFTSTTIEKWGYKHGFILANRYSMPFDAFYISILSEKYRKSYFPIIRGIFTGIVGWFKTQSKKGKSSSIVYVFRKKQNER
ncbi:Ubiquinone biosynthesis O-methyltransferase [termite gut metagenome]|uniref:Ubiquinone biosynthesis O-methyltransferase n=1 Tax=termite gut metagenome TaxID=433724 RepID=A0A5J4RYA0_9ZZZZ